MIQTLTMILHIVHKILITNIVHVALAISVMVVVMTMRMRRLQIVWRGTRSVFQMILIAFETMQARGHPI